MPNAYRLAISSLVLMLSGCATHMLPRALTHLQIHWASDYAAASVVAQHENKPLLVVLAAGPIDGACCYGADAMRGDALSDPRVIDLINRTVIPVWINIRSQPVPRGEAIKGGLVTAKLDADNRVIDTFSKCFFNRSIVLSPDGSALLNPAVGTVAKGIGVIATEGKLGYAEINAGDYLVMLKRAVAKHRGEDGILLGEI